MRSLALDQTRPAPGPLAVLAAIDREGAARQPLLWAMAKVMLALAVPTGVAYLLDVRTVNDIDVWSKPLKFEISLTVFFATLAWFWGYLPDARQRGRFLNACAVVTVTCAAFEMTYMIVQSGRGAASHFNTSTALEGILFMVMGAGAMVLTAMAPILGFALVRGRRPDVAPALHLAVIVGLVLTFLLGATVGAIMGENGGHWVSAPHTDAGGFPIFGWTRQGGDLRVAHFLGIHAMQVLPLFGFLVARRRPVATGVVSAGAALFAAATLYTLVEALSGRPFLGFVG